MLCFNDWKEKKTFQSVNLAKIVTGNSFILKNVITFVLFIRENKTIFYFFPVKLIKFNWRESKTWFAWKFQNPKKS